MNRTTCIQQAEKRNASSQMNYHVASASTHLVLSAKKNKLIIFRWEYILSMGAVLKQEILMLFQTIYIHLLSISPEQAGLPP